jgi:hypothetical protein
MRPELCLHLYRRQCNGADIAPGWNALIDEVLAAET